jgi:hypothetical protein
MEPLPCPSKVTIRNANALSAYERCYNFQENSEASRESARILGYMILYAPSPNAEHEIVKQIHSCQNNVALKDLALYYRDNFIKPCK